MTKQQDNRFQPLARWDQTIRSVIRTSRPDFEIERPVQETVARVFEEVRFHTAFQVDLIQFWLPRKHFWTHPAARAGWRPS